MGDFVPLIRTFQGVQHYMRTNDDGSHTFAASQDVEGVLEANKAARNTNDGYNKDRTMRRVASIPVVVQLAWLNEDPPLDIYNPEHSDRLAKRLNDPDWSLLRTADGRISALADGGFR
jgi:hypothetical protein